MLRFIGMFALGIACVTDDECQARKGAESKCVLTKTAPSCDKEKRCSDPYKEKAYQSCECKHLNNGTCTSQFIHLNNLYEKVDNCDEVLRDDICPENPSFDDWYCCTNPHFSAFV